MYLNEMQFEPMVFEYLKKGSLLILSETTFATVFILLELLVNLPCKTTTEDYY
jgi:hypothetical protein